MYLHEGLQWVLSVFPYATDILFKMLFSLTEVFTKYQRTAISWDVFNIPHYIARNHREAEVAVPVDKCGKLLEDLIKAKTTLNIYINHIIEVSYVVIVYLISRYTNSNYQLPTYTCFYHVCIMLFIYLYHR